MFQGATSTIVTFARSCNSFSATITGYLFRLCWPCFFTVNNTMAFITQRQSVINFISKFWIIFPSFYMMRLERFASATMPTGIIISFKNIPSPLSVFPRSSTFVRRVFSSSGVHAILPAVFCFKMSANWIKAVTAVTTLQFCFGKFLLTSLDGAFCRANFIVPSTSALKSFTAYYTVGAFAVFAILGARVINCKFFVTCRAYSFFVKNPWLFVVDFVIRMLSAKLVFPPNYITASWVRACDSFVRLISHLIPKIKPLRRLGGAVVEAATRKALEGVRIIIAGLYKTKSRPTGNYCLDIDIITQMFFYGKRWSQHTGQQPELSG